jgi:hypothetical protein
MLTYFEEKGDILEIDDKSKLSILGSNFFIVKAYKSSFQITLTSKLKVPQF